MNPAIPCNSSVTPWMTHLGSEEYEPDARVFEKRPLEQMNLYLGTPGKTAAEGGANPYRYGHLTEVAVAPNGTTTVTKHYAMGRLSFELGDCHAHQKTVYLGDDGDDVIRGMFIADRPADISAGTLYAARWMPNRRQEFRLRQGWNGSSSDMPAMPRSRRSSAKASGSATYGKSPMLIR